MNQNKELRLKNVGFGLMVGLFFWMLFWVLLAMMGVFNNSSSISYISSIAFILLFSTCILIGIWIFNKENSRIRRLLIFDISFLFAGVFMASMDILLHPHPINNYIPISIYMCRLIYAYIF